MIGEPATVNIVRYRGDTWSPEFEIRQGGAAYDVTGHTFKLTVNPQRAPADDAVQAFQVAGAVVDGPAGLVRFPIGAAEAGLAPGSYRYDIQETNDQGEIRTIVVGGWLVRQDITK